MLVQWMKQHRSHSYAPFHKRALDQEKLTAAHVQKHEAISTHIHSSPTTYNVAPSNRLQLSAPSYSVPVGGGWTRNAMGNLSTHDSRHQKKRS